MTDDVRRQWGRVGGLKAQALHGSDAMLSAAHKGFQARFERLVDPDLVLDPAERATRAARLRRSHMLMLAQRSAQVRRARLPKVSEADGEAAG